MDAPFCCIHTSFLRIRPGEWGMMGFTSVRACVCLCVWSTYALLPFTGKKAFGHASFNRSSRSCFRLSTLDILNLHQYTCMNIEKSKLTFIGHLLLGKTAFGMNGKVALLKHKGRGFWSGFLCPLDCVIFHSVHDWLHSTHLVPLCCFGRMRNDNESRPERLYCYSPPLPPARMPIMSMPLGRSCAVQQCPRETMKGRPRGGGAIDCFAIFLEHLQAFASQSES